MLGSLICGWHPHVFEGKFTSGVAAKPCRKVEGCAELRGGQHVMHDLIRYANIIHGYGMVGFESKVCLGEFTL